MLRVKCKCQILIRISWLFLLLVVLNGKVQAQILNIELSRIQQDTNGFKGKLNANFNLLKNNYQTLSFGSSMHLQYKHNKHLIMALSSVSFISTDGSDYANSGFQHLRYNYDLRKQVKLEAFTQIQYNKVAGLDQRFLMGIGPRFVLKNSEKHKIFVGIAYMYEYEELSDTAVFNHEHRSTSYLAMSNSFGDHVELQNTLYYQPLFTDVSDFRINWAGKLRFKLSKRLWFSTQWGVSYDAFPPPNVVKLSYSVRNGIEFKI